jgi:hypothetical protein
MAQLKSKQLTYPLSGSFTGSLYGTASYAITASYAMNGGGGGGTPGGNLYEIQYNNGTFGGVPVLTYDGTTLVGTGSFSGSFTGLINSASYAATASYAPDYVLIADTGSMTVLSSSYAATASLATTASYSITASYSNTSTSASYALSSSYSVSSSQAQNAISSSYALSSSFATTASYYLETDPVFVAKSASLATTGSNIFIGDQTITGSINLTGSLNQIGDYTHTGSVYHSGSKFLNGIFVQTGSLSITGSTTQIGNNTLAGNTTLSGSIIISGSTTVPATPTIKIYGDMETDGVIKFMPVSKNIDTSISASYIYVSGSTNDLYFSQNGSGYNNVTRLRWIEGSLYSGLLHGGLITTQSNTVYQIQSGSGIIVNLNASQTTDPYPTIQYLNWGTLSASIAPLSASFDQSFVAINSASQIFAQGTPYENGDYNEKIPIGNVIHQNRSSINATATYPSLGYGWKQRSSDFIRAFGPLKLSGLDVAASGSSTGSLIITQGTSFNDGRNYTQNANNPSYVQDSGSTVSKIFRYYQSGSGWGYQTNAGVGFEAIDPTLYSDNGTGDLIAVPGTGANRQWTIQRVYWFTGGATKGIYVYYGNKPYLTKADAIANINIESFIEAPNTRAGAVLSGYLILRNNADFTVPESYQIIPAGLFRNVGGSGGGGSTVTNTLAGLSDVSLGTLSYGDLLMYDSTHWYNTKTLSGSYTLSGSLNATGGITGSFLGTASYATYAANGGVTQLLAGTGISLAPTNGLGQVTITSTGGGSGIYGNTATGSYGSFYDTTTQTNPVINVNRSMSLDTTGNSNGVSISGSTDPYDTYIKFQNPGVYDLQFSAQIEKTSSGNTSIVYIWLRKNGIDLVQTNTIVELSQNGKAVAAWNWFLNVAPNDYYQIMWAADRTDVQLAAVSIPSLGPSIPSVIATVSRIDQFLSNTGSFTGSFTGELIGTASYATNGLSSSYSISSSYSVSSSQAISSSFATTASYITASNVYGPYGSNSVISASFAVTSSYVTGSIFTSDNLVLSSSYALTASYALTSAGGGSGAGFPFTGSAVITGSLIVTGSATFTDSIIVDAVLMTSSLVTTTGGNTTLFTQATGSYRSMFTKYNIVSSTNDARAGEFMMIWNGLNFKFTDTSTTDIGDTSALVLTGSLTATNVELSTGVGTGWTVKTQTTFV